jgi:hypothetical protein
MLPVDKVYEHDHCSHQQHGRPEITDAKIMRRHCVISGTLIDFFFPEASALIVPTA